MSALKINSIQIGQSQDSSNNFTWYQPTTPDGTIRLSRGNSGATDIEIISINKSGNTSFNYPIYSTNTITASVFSGSGASLTSLPAANLSGTIASGVLGNSTVYVGTTAIALNRASGSQTLTGVSIDGNADTSGYILNTNIGRTGSQGFISTTGWGTANWANQPISGLGMTIASTPGAPNTNYGFFNKFGNRDAGGPGWGGMWMDYDGSNIYYGATTVSTSYAAWKKLLDASNYSSYSNFGTNAVYGGTYYDGGNTAYYVDPASTSNVNAVTQNGDIYLPGSGASWITGLQGGYANIYDNDPNNGNYRAFIRSINTSYTFSMGRLSNNYIGFFNYLNTRTVNGTDGSAYLDVSGNWYSSSSMRAPIFYDSNNTAYYLNPADFSELYNIRTYGPNLARTINATGYAWLFQYSSNSGSSYTNVGSIFMSSSSTQYATTSDYRLKENIRNVEGAINKLMQLQPRTFNFISNPDETIDGFIAHELQEHFPNAVAGQKDAVDENGEIIAQGIDTSKLVATMVSAIQEQQTQIQDLQNKLNSLLHPQQTDK